jgi:hypothetical protein
MEDKVDFKKIKKINKSIDNALKNKEKYQSKLDEFINKIKIKIGSNEPIYNYWMIMIEMYEKSDKFTPKQKEKLNERYSYLSMKLSEIDFDLFSDLNLTNEELKYINFEKFSKYQSINLSNNNLQSLENIPDNSNIYNNPIAKKIIPYRQLDERKISKENLIGKNYETYVLPKGTLLFRQYRKIEDVQASFVGYKLKEDDGNYYLHPEHRTFGIVFPTFKTKFGGYGNIDVIIVLQNDVKLFINCGDSVKKYYKECEENISKTYNANNKCLPKEFKEKEIMGWICPCDEESKITNGGPCSSTINLSEDLGLKKYKPKNFLEYQLYPRKVRSEIDIITKQEDFDESWMKKNLKEFNYKPFMIFDETVTSEEYKSIFDKLLSPEGFTNEDGTFHVTVNKIDGTYVLAEEATRKTLEDCVSLKEDRLTYLKEYVKNQ